MNEKEIREIRRRFKGERINFGFIRGCYVNDEGEIITDFSQQLLQMTTEETDEILGIMKKTLSGSIGSNLINIEFSNEQVMNSPEHKLLMTLRDSALKDDAAVNEFFKKVSETVRLDGSYLILLANDRYDVFKYSKDGEKEEDSSEVFSYIICSICPIKLTRPALSFKALENAFQNIGTNTVVAPSQLGFVFPAFDDRTANIYNALYYTKDTWGKHNDFLEAVFGTKKPMPARIQQATFTSILKDTIEDECNLEVVQAVHDQISEIVLEAKQNHEDEPPTVNKDTLKVVLKTCGVKEEKVEKFSEEYDKSFGEDTEITPQNIINPKTFEVTTPDVTIKVNPERNDLVSTKVIDGKKYIMILADEGVEVNGIDINIS